MTILIQIPGTLASTAGLNRVLTTNNGFPDDGLASLFLFQDGSGSAPANSVSGGAAAAIEDLLGVNAASSWLSGGGGLNLQGSKGISMPAIDVTAPWTIVSAGMVIGSVPTSDTTSAKSATLMTFRTPASNNFRGARLNLASGTNWNVPPVATNYQMSVSNGAGGSSSIVTTTPSSLTTAVGSGRVRVMSYNGVDTITGAIYDKNGSVITSGSIAATDALLSTGLSGVVVTNLQPTIGLPTSSTSAWGNQNEEAAAVYTRTLAAADITAICSASAALAAARGRAW